jgi:hypothetical protein
MGLVALLISRRDSNPFNLLDNRYQGEHLVPLGLVLADIQGVTHSQRHRIGCKRMFSISVLEFFIKTDRDLAAFSTGHKGIGL